MSKIGLIIKKEYTTRVVKKSFILMTFLTPLLFVGIIILPTWIANLQDSTKKHVIVVDRTNMYHEVLKSNDIYTFDFVNGSVEQIRETNTNNKDFTALLVISDDLSRNPKAATLYSEKQLNVELKSYISSLLSKQVEEQKLAAYNIPDLKEMIQDSKADLEISTIKWGTDGEEKEASAEMALIIGMVAAMLIYMFIIMYGTQVMNGVMQEKANRIVEVIVSSVRPFELMMGKIIGIALVGLTQFLMWVVLTFILLTIGSLFMNGSLDMSAINDLSAMQGISISEVENMTTDFYKMISSFNWLQIGILFVIYFLGGYLLYASLFAAIGSSVDNETDANQFTLPITLPIILSIFVALYSVRSPESSFAFWFSIIPFTSPVVMMVRLPFDVPTWEIILSIAVLILSFMGTTWVAGKIYRTGILMYGKKVTWKEMWKWIKY
ncbi:ABC transporter permease [Paludibacter sp. 221]|uniref:ABC transporter permease n=1 Tax=Paludibacter sp. 221 TaxID=2302939 RepID=UPI0013D53360|nr:ABC transporter permease [Paludibacter sp. 221]NDV47871.1 ABC transporter permease [Paludibacter sp. 221]